MLLWEGKDKVDMFDSTLPVASWENVKVILDAFERGHLTMNSDSDSSFCGLEQHFTTFNLQETYFLLVQ